MTLLLVALGVLLFLTLASLGVVGYQCQGDRVPKDQRAMYQGAGCGLVVLLLLLLVCMCMVGSTPESTESKGNTEEYFMNELAEMSTDPTSINTQGDLWR